MELLASLERELQQLDAARLRRRRRVADTPCAPHVTVDGRPMLAFCSNDYLGLAAHPRLVEALREGAARYGVGSGASHLIWAIRARTCCSRSASPNSWRRIWKRRARCTSAPATWPTWRC